MNDTSRAIFQTVLSSDQTMSPVERGALQRLIEGRSDSVREPTTNVDDHLLITQKRAAEILSVSRATIWRMTKDAVLHPVEIVPGTWRYRLREILHLAQNGVAGAVNEPFQRRSPGFAPAA
jgi:predicted DNA-binding transcriptional regulator AlpA